MLRWWTGPNSGWSISNYITWSRHYDHSLHISPTACFGSTHVNISGALGLGKDQYLYMTFLVFFSGVHQAYIIHIPDIYLNIPCLPYTWYIYLKLPVSLWVAETATHAYAGSLVTGEIRLLFWFFYIENEIFLDILKFFVPIFSNFDSIFLENANEFF